MPEINLGRVRGDVVYARLLTLTAAGWSADKKQTVACAGILADEGAQRILPMPTEGSRAAYDTAGVQCVAQGADKLTFAASNDVPTADLSVYVSWESVEVLG